MILFLLCNGIKNTKKLFSKNYLNIKKTYASKTIIKIKNEIKSGWILYDRIRWKENEVIEFGDF